MDVLVATEPPSRILLRTGELGATLRQLAGESEAPAFLVADARAFELHGDKLGHLAELPRFVVEPGEASKSMANLEVLLYELCDAGLDRHSRLLAFGGGVTSDLAGLAAALFMRGIKWTSVPTTLLAQVDASVGGKTAVNLPQGKNLVGAFHQPTAVVVDTTLCATLERREWRSGLGEVLKAALLGARLEDGTLLFDWLEALDEGALAAPDPSRLPTAEQTARWTTLVHACIAHKAAVVTADFKETGTREQLNLGHTFAHAIEHVAGFGTIPHGVAVAAGLRMALEKSRQEGLLEDADLPARTAALSRILELPMDLEDLSSELKSPLNRLTLGASMSLDKKSVRGFVRYVLPRAIGQWTAMFHADSS